MYPNPTPAFGDLEATNIARVLACASDLGRESDPLLILRGTVEFLREQLRLERVGLHLYDPVSGMMRGTWGTGLEGETVDERACLHQLPASNCTGLSQMHARGELWGFNDLVVQHIKTCTGQGVARRTWLAVTPLVARGELLGVMYNDCALTQRSVNRDAQRHAALFCGLIAQLLVSKRASLVSEDAPAALRHSQTGFMRRAFGLLERDPLMSGKRLAELLRVSPGHISRRFRLEVGMSLVEYRNRLRIARFRTLVDSGETNLLAAALGAGFGSYAQFHRVYRQLIGGSPREYVRDHVPSQHGDFGEP